MHTALPEEVADKMKAVYIAEQIQTELIGSLKNVMVMLSRPGVNAVDELDKQIASKEELIRNGKKAAALSADRLYCLNSVLSIFKEVEALLQREGKVEGEEAFKELKADFDKRTKMLKKQAEAAGKNLTNVFNFCEDVFDDGQEMLILVTELTVSCYGAHFISRYGCKEYFAHNKELLFYERQKEIIQQIDALEMDLNVSE